MRHALLTLLSITATGWLSAQTPAVGVLPERAWLTHTHTVSGQLGVGWFGLISNLQLDAQAGEDGVDTEGFDFTFSGGPAATLAYDYRFGRSFSLGGAVAFQGNRFTDFARDLGPDGREAVGGGARLRRTFISARTLWHYGRARNVELYSGLRVGLTVWRGSATGEIGRDDGIFEGPSAAFVLPHLTIIPFGLKGYVGEDFFVGFETMFGSPHVLAAQAGYRF